MTLESSKTLGGVGALLVVIGFLGFFGTGYAGILALVGIILTLIALKGMADNYNEIGIFNNALYGVITIIVGVVVFIAVLAIMVLTTVLSGLDWTNPASIQAYFMDFNNIWNILGTIIAALVALFIFMIISAIFFRKSLSTLAMKSGERIFETAGLLWLIGAVLTIILVGFILIGIAWILIAVGFFSIKTGAAQPSPPPPPQQ
jgi:uncharacterized membrane protein